jgi:hypothetical protein
MESRDREEYRQPQETGKGIEVNSPQSFLKEGSSIDALI